MNSAKTHERKININERFTVNRQTFSPLAYRIAAAKVLYTVSTV